MSGPILYSFRRCPYAMRARLALKAADVRLEIREVVLKDKPAEMLMVSPKATVPVLVFADGQVIDESLDIMHWALMQLDSGESFETDKAAAEPLLTVNDGKFKYHLDHYKYFERFPAHSQQQYRQRGEEFLLLLEKQLAKGLYLFGDKPGFADMAIFPFIRQFAHVDTNWFYASDYHALQAWLSRLLEWPLFRTIMHKHHRWQTGDEPIYL